MPLRLIALAAILALMAPPAVCADTGLTHRPIAAVRTTVPPKVDGDLTDPCWPAAPTAQGFVDRQTGAPATDATTVRLVYDATCIYVAFDAHDSRPAEIVGRETVRDSHYSNGGMSIGDDFLEVTFDTYRTARWDDQTRFSVSPAGTPSARFASGRASKMEWKGAWEAAARRTATGWTAEMRIPWAILNYPASRTPVTMGINFARGQNRTQVVTVWSNTGPEGFNDRQGLWTGVQPPAGSFRPVLSALPYLLPSLDGSRTEMRAGLDARYTATPDLTAVATLNPDFATIEGAVEGIQFSRAERYIPDRRPFFLEGANAFWAGEDYAIGQYFYPRRIDQMDMGLKLFGKLSPMDSIGLLTTADVGRRSDMVARYTRTLSPTSSVGFFASQKSAHDDNSSLGVLLHRTRWGKFAVETEWAGSSGRDSGGDAKRLSLQYIDKTNYTELQYLEAAPRFRAAEGIVYFTDYRGARLYQMWGAEWRRGPWRSYTLEFFPRYNWHFDGRPFQRGVGLNLDMVTRSDWFFSIDGDTQRFDDQTDTVVGLSIRHGVSNRFRQWRLRFETGTSGDRPSSFIRPELNLRVLRRLDMAYGGALLNLDGHRQQHILTLGYELSPNRSFGGRIVIQDADTNWYLSYRNSGASGTETYVILGDPNAARFTRRIAFKLVFSLG